MDKNFCVFKIQKDFFTEIETNVFYLDVKDVFDKFLELGAVSVRIDCGKSCKQKPFFFMGKKVKINDKGVFYQ